MDGGAVIPRYLQSHKGKVKNILPKASTFVWMCSRADFPEQRALFKDAFHLLSFSCKFSWPWDLPSGSSNWCSFQSHLYGQCVIQRWWGEISIVIMCLYQVNLYFMVFGQIDFCETPWGVCKYESSCSFGCLFAFTGRIKRRRKTCFPCWQTPLSPRVW